MKQRKEVAPSLEDLSYAQIESSYLFGFTNISGKVLALGSAVALIPGAMGVFQGMGAAGTAASLWTGLGILGASTAGALTGYWLGNFDDKKIKAHNRNASWSFNSRARHKVYNDIENAFASAISKVQYDPGKKHLPYDALGHAVLLTDDKIEPLPAHVRLDIYRTQLDRVLHSNGYPISTKTEEGWTTVNRIMNSGLDMEKKAEEYRQLRDRVRAMIKDGTLRATPIEKPVSKRSGLDLSSLSDDMPRSRGSGGRISFGGGSSSASSPFGGGRSGGGGGGASWDSVASSLTSNLSSSQSLLSNMGNMPLSVPVESSGWGFGGGSSSGSSSGSSNRKSGNSEGIGKAAAGGAGLLLKFAGVAAVIAAATASAFSLHKNFLDEADELVLPGGVRLPMIARSLATAEKDIRLMYA